MRRSTIHSVLFAAVLIAGALLAERFGLHLLPELDGPVRIVDGDSLEVGGERVRLEGIDAPELDQRCGLAAKDWACGTSARAALRKAVGRDAVTCRPVGTDRYGRSVSVCEAGGRDLGAAMVGEGLAVATGFAYAREQEEARRAKRGLWSGPFEEPASWRARKGWRGVE